MNWSNSEIYIKNKVFFRNDLRWESRKMLKLPDKARRTIYVWTYKIQTEIYLDDKTFSCIGVELTHPFYGYILLHTHTHTMSIRSLKILSVLISFNFALPLPHWITFGVAVNTNVYHRQRISMKECSATKITSNGLNHRASTFRQEFCFSFHRTNDACWLNHLPNNKSMLLMLSNIKKSIRFTCYFSVFLSAIMHFILLRTIVVITFLSVSSCVCLRIIVGSTCFVNWSLFQISWNRIHYVWARFLWDFALSWFYYHFQGYVSDFTFI